MARLTWVGTVITGKIEVIDIKKNRPIYAILRNRGRGLITKVGATAKLGKNEAKYNRLIRLVSSPFIYLRTYPYS